jgi:hypothetical protein
MSAIKPVSVLHRKGEASSTPDSFPPPYRVDTFGGTVEVHWEPASAVTRHGLLAYFIDFLKTSNTWTEFTDSCPLTYSSPNAPLRTEVLATIVYSILTGQRRYSPIAALSSDSVMAGLFGVKTFRSEVSVRRVFEDANDEAVTAWLDQEMDRTFAPLREQPWVLDLDATITTLYGHQEEARIGYNPTKPGRPSHVYQVMVLAAGKLVLNVDAQAGNQSASEYAQPTLLGWLDERNRRLWPTLMRGSTEFVDSCPLTYCRPNAPINAEVLATITYSILAGQRRYSNITALSGDSVMAGLFGVKTFRSEDSVRRAFDADDAVTAAIDQQMDRTFAPLLEQPWVLDLDATIKTLCGHQEEARVGYSPLNRIRSTNLSITHNSQAPDRAAGPSKEALSLGPLITLIQ